MTDRRTPPPPRLVRAQPAPRLALPDASSSTSRSTRRGSRAVRDADARGTVVYVLRNLSFVDFFALDYLTKRHDLPQVRFANDLGLWVLEPMGRGWLERASRARRPRRTTADLERAVASGASAALFLKRPPARSSKAASRGQDRGRPPDPRALRRAAPERRAHPPRPAGVRLVAKRRDARQQRRRRALRARASGRATLRSIAQFLANWRHATLRAGEPVDLARVPRARERRTARATTSSSAASRTRSCGASSASGAPSSGPREKPADRLREEVDSQPEAPEGHRRHGRRGRQPSARSSRRARSAMLREMEAALDMNAIAALEQVVRAGARRACSRRSRSTRRASSGCASCAKEGTLVLLPSHKSHMDYMVLAWLLYRTSCRFRSSRRATTSTSSRSAPSSGAPARSSSAAASRATASTRAVVDAYVRRLIKDGSPLEFFLEGGRSRTGKLLPPKLGLLSLVVDAALGVPTRTTWFCPVSIGYERFVEEKAFVRELTRRREAEGGRARPRASRSTSSSAATGGSACSSGSPLTLADVLARDRPRARTTDDLATHDARRGGARSSRASPTA